MWSEKQSKKMLSLGFEILLPMVKYFPIVSSPLHCILDCTFLKIKESQPALFLIQAFLNLKNQIFLNKRPPRSKTVTHQGHKGRKNFGWENFFYLISRQIGQF